MDRLITPFGLGIKFIRNCLNIFTASYTRCCKPYSRNIFVIECEKNCFWANSRKTDVCVDKNHGKTPADMAYRGQYLNGTTSANNCCPAAPGQIGTGSTPSVRWEIRALGYGIAVGSIIGLTSGGRTIFAKTPASTFRYTIIVINLITSIAESLTRYVLRTFWRRH